MTIGRLYKICLVLVSPVFILVLIGLYGQVLKGDWGGMEFLPLVLVAMFVLVFKKVVRLVK